MKFWAVIYFALFSNFVVCLPVPPLQLYFLFPRPLLCHSPSIPQSSSDFPSFSHHLTAPPTCLHFPHQPHPVYSTPVLFLCSSVSSSLLWCGQLCCSCLASCVFALEFLSTRTCLPACPSVTCRLSTCHPVCHQPPVYLPFFFQCRVRLFHRDYYIFVTSQGRPKWNSCYRLAAMGHKTGYRLSLWFIVLPKKFPPLRSFVFYFSFLQEICRNWLK